MMCKMLTMLMITFISSCAPAQLASAASADEAQQGVMSYRIGSADILSISVWKQDGMNRTVTVRPDGMISFPLLGDVRAAGLTPSQLENVLTNGLRKYLKLLDGELTVMVDAVHSYTVSVLGEVRTPGRFEFQKPVTVLDALAEAGGFTQFASPSKIQILRTDANGARTIIPFDYKKVSSSALNKQLDVRPGDIVMVP
jgi:polysaccharide export outer membrane protein